jgi:hypothetical protein
MSARKGYLLYDDVNEVVPEDLATGSSFDDILADLEVAGVELLDEPKLGFGKRAPTMRSCSTAS